MLRVNAVFFEVVLKITFITHYFPPLNSSGARRVNAFAKYLSSWGHEITVITTRKTERDGLLTESVPGYLRLIELDTFGQARATVGASAETQSGNIGVQTRSFSGRVLLRIKRSVMKSFGQLLDHRLLFAIQFVVPWLSQDVKAALRASDVVISSCPPWPVHLAGRFVKMVYGTPWVADYRDQFSGSHILYGSGVSQKIEVMLERWLLRHADCVTAISGPMQEYYAQFHDRVFCIENGYDEAVFSEAVVGIQREPAGWDPAKKVIRYLGTITTDRIPEGFLRALVLANQHSRTRLVAEFYGESTLLRRVVSERFPEAAPYVQFFPQLPYSKAIGAMLTADALFLVETSDFSSLSARGVLTTKLFEYLAARKPVVAEISGESLIAQYIERSGLGVVVSQDSSSILKGLNSLLDGTFQPYVNAAFIESLSRKVKTEQFAKVLADVVERPRE